MRYFMGFGLLLMFVLVEAGLAKRGGPGRQGERVYNPQTETRIVGVVDGVYERPAKFRAEMIGYHLYVKDSDGEIYFVHLGPKAFYQDQGVEFQRGDKVEVTGSKIEMANGKAYYIAREIDHSGGKVVVRDDLGRPLYRRQLRGMKATGTDRGLPGNQRNPMFKSLM
jgi:hypothetical protein